MDEFGTVDTVAPSLPLEDQFLQEFVLRVTDTEVRDRLHMIRD